MIRRPDALHAVVFDFDGVLVNTEPLHLLAYQQMLAERGISLTPEEYFTRFLGFDDEGVFRAVSDAWHWRLSDREVAALIAEKARRMEALLSQAELFPGAGDCVRRLASELPLAIASGALGSEIHQLLEQTGLRPCFQAVVAAGDTPRSKPAPDPYTMAVSRLRESGLVPADAPPATCVAIEDSRWGIESARAAGLRCVAVTQTYPAEELEGAELIIPSLSDLTIEQLRALCDS